MFFFFGTLMDLDVLARVVGRPVAPDELSPAAIEGYRRVRARDEAFPVLVPCRDAVVEGRLMQPVSQAEEARIAWFEEGEYTERWRRVRRHDGRVLDARVFFGLPALGTTAESWDPDDWARREKAAFLRRCERWLKGCPVQGRG